MLLCLEYDLVTLENLSASEIDLVSSTQSACPRSEVLEEFSYELLDLEIHLLPQRDRSGNLHQNIADDFNVEFVRLLEHSSVQTRTGILWYFEREVAFYSCVAVFVDLFQRFVAQSDFRSEELNHPVRLAHRLRSELPMWLEEIGKSYQLETALVQSIRNGCQNDVFAQSTKDLWQKYLAWTIHKLSG